MSVDANVSLSGRVVTVLGGTGFFGRHLAQELLALCKRELAGPKQPRAVEFLNELPRSEAGKLLRRVLKERYL